MQTAQNQAHPPKLEIYTLGGLRIVRDGEPLTKLASRKVEGLLVYLACVGRSQPREVLAELLWDDFTQSRAMNNLRVVLSNLRKHVGDFVTITRESAAINLDANVWVDVVAFEKALSEVREAENGMTNETAVSLYQGSFLDGFYTRDARGFNDWFSIERERLQRLMLDAIGQLVSWKLAQKEYVSGIEQATRWLQLDPSSEMAHQQMMRLLAYNGQQPAAIRQFEACVQMLDEELGLEPSSQTLELFSQIRAGQLYKPQTQENEQPSPHNLPHLHKSFISRGNEIDAAASLVMNNRLVLLSGAGGVGKTTLSIKVGQHVLDAFPDGIWLVELAPITEPAHIAQAIMSGLGLRESPAQTPQARILGFLQQKECLLILDNCEHLIEATAQLAETALQRCPRLKILASSREVLNIGEAVYSVPSLSLPNENRATAVEEWQQYGAMRLFVERATAVQPQFKVTETNIQAITQICQQLDGIPLALELAAARTKILLPEQIASRLGDRFRFLTAGQRTAVPRQQTLQALVDWSWELLSPPEQALLRRLAIFSGGITLSTVESICTDETVDLYSVLDLLSELVNKSLLLVNHSQAQKPRYHLLETIRQYGLQRLVDADERKRYRQRHLDAYAYIAEQAEQELLGPNQVDWLHRLQTELDNIRSALNWAKKNDSEAGLRIASSLWKFWEAKGNMREGATWLAQLLEEAGDVLPAVRAKALGVQSDLNMYLFNIELAQSKARACLTLFRELEHPDGIAFGLNRVVTIYSFKKEFAIGLELTSESLAICQETDNQYGMAESYQKMARMVLHDAARVRECLEKSLAIYKKMGHLGGMSAIYYAFGFMAWLQGNYEEAQTWLEKNLKHDEQFGLPINIYTFLTLANVKFSLGDHPLAQDYFEKTLSISQQTGETRAAHWATLHLGHLFLRADKPVQAIKRLQESLDNFSNGAEMIGLVYALEGIAGFAVTRERPKTAVNLLAWTDATRESFGDLRPAFEQAFVDQDVAHAVDMMDETEYKAAYADGRKMSKEQAVALGLTNF
ncbi:MAG: BTAD domain-containing putative transcriptional regulator [Chloroflexota bacterium]